MELKHPVVHGHPLHAMVSDFPIALVPVALAASLVARRRAAAGTAALAAGSAVTAVAIGWWDWLTIPREHPAWRTATIHGLINTAVLGACVIGVASRERRAVALGSATAALAVSAWLGGELVYALGWRVRPAEMLEQIEAGKTREEARRTIDEHERRNTLLA